MRSAESSAERTVASRAVSSGRAAHAHFGGEISVAVAGYGHGCFDAVEGVADDGFVVGCAQQDAHGEPVFVASNFEPVLAANEGEPGAELEEERWR